MKITLTVQLGGSDSSKICHPLIISLRKSLKLIQNNHYCTLEHFKLQMRISGEISEFKEETGIHYLRLMKKRNYVMGEIVFGKEVWTNKTTLEVVSAFCYYTEQLFLGIIDKLKKNAIEIDHEKLMLDLKNIALDQFRKDNI